MRILFIFSLLFFIFGLLASPASAATYQCPGFSNTYPDPNGLKNCQSNCPNNSCTQVSDAGAGGSTGGTSGQFKNPLKSQSFEALVQSLAKWVAAIALPIAAIFIIYSGFLFVTAGGNQSKIDAAKTTFYWTIIGAAIVVGAWALATAIVNFASKL